VLDDLAEGWDSRTVSDSGKTPGRPVDAGENWTPAKLLVLGFVTLGSALVFLYFVSPFP